MDDSACVSVIILPLFTLLKFFKHLTCCHVYIVTSGATILEDCFGKNGPAAWFFVNCGSLWNLLTPVSCDNGNKTCGNKFTRKEEYYGALFLFFFSAAFLHQIFYRT